MVSAAIGTIFAQPDAEAVAAQFERIVGTLSGEFPVVAGHAHRRTGGPTRLCCFPG